ncbi:PAS domain-containing protein [Halochromatium glycolicum]|nr:PAS domain-containing protein [Halochromatium glycolicum]
MDGIPSSVLLLDESLRITMVNRHFLEKTRRSKRNTLGQFITDVLPPEILDHAGGVQQHIEQALRSGEAQPGNRIGYRAPGLARRVYYYSVIPLPRHDGSQWVMVFIEDVSEQVRLAEEVRQAERRLALVVESASDIVLSTDNEGHILTWNTAAEAFFGLSSAEVSGRWFADLCSGQDCQEAASKLLAQIKRGIHSLTAEWQLMAGDGQSRLISWVFSAMRNDYGEVIGVVAVGRDLTERREFEKQLQRSQKLAALGVMAGGIAHEVRGPLSTCYSAVQFLEEAGLDEELREQCIEKIRGSVLKASYIIENLLRFARPAADDEMVETDLCQLLQETVDLVANQAKVQQVRLSLNRPPCPLPLRAVPNLLQQMFLNMFLNAINAMPDGGELRVDVHPDDDQVCVDIVDTGIGIAEQDLPKIFDPFHTATKGPEAVGLGLSICHSIARRHLGTIHVTSELGKGSTFRVELPIT